MGSFNYLILIIISNPRRFESLYPYGIEFSPDSKYLYSTSSNGFIQFQVKNKSFEEILNSKYNYGFRMFWNLQLSPNGKIYSSNHTLNYSDSEANEIDTIKWEWFYYANPTIGLSGFNASYFNSDPYIVYYDNCSTNLVNMRLFNNENVASVNWNFGDGNTIEATSNLVSHEYENNGSYQAVAEARMKDGTIKHVNKKIIVKKKSIDVLKDTVICDQDSFKLSASPYKYDCFTWSDGSSDFFISVQNEGWYWIDVRKSGCYFRDSIYVKFNTTPILDLGEDKILCDGEELQLSPEVSAEEYL